MCIRDRNYVDDKLRVEFRLWDVLAAKEMMALAFTTVPNNWRRVGHIISDKVYERLTGDCLLYTSPSPRDRTRSRMPSSA